ncbi:MAG: BamA/TamA family outer membrane protein, partial [Fibrobacteria bacterium]|nr:BamA/TamA family outer membrane protein [Fibrobacteria bacterium]
YELTIEGNIHFSNRKIKSFFILPKTFENSSIHDITKWSEGIKSELIYQYEDLGFFDVSVGVAVQADSSEGEKEWQVNIIITEGPRYLIDRVILNILDSSRSLITKKKLRSRPLREFNVEDMDRDKRDIEKIYGDIGFAKRRVSQRIDFNDSAKTVDVVFDIDPSYLVIFDTLIIRNKREKKSEYTNGLSDPDLMQRILKFKRGDTVRLSKTNLYKSKLKSTRVFNYVRIKDSILVDKNNRSALLLLTEEKIPGHINSALFWETLEGFGGEAGWAYNNILGQFYDTEVKTRIAQRRQYVHVSIGNPLLLGYKLRYDNELDFIWRHKELVDRYEMSPFDAIFSSSLSRPFSSWAHFVGTIEFERTTEQTVDESNVLKDPRVINLNGIATLSLSFVDNEFNPRRGSRFSFIYGNGGPLIDEDKKLRLVDLRHNWGELNSSYFYPFITGFVGALRLNGGAFSNAGKTNARRFFLGGKNSIRSANFREVCPEKELYYEEGKDSSNVCVPNSTPVYYLASLELRMQLLSGFHPWKNAFWDSFRQMQIVPFTDYGKIWQSGEKVLPEGEGFSVGLGVRVPLMFFNFRFDYALGWDAGPDWGMQKFIIDLAQAF